MNAWPDCFWKLGALLMHQQCWNFGRDVLSPHGNLLTGAGFAKSPRPERRPGSSRYLRQRSGEPGLCLWAFGSLAFLPGEGGIYMNRYNLLPQWVGNPETALATWNSESFAGCEPVATRRRIRIAKRLLRFTFQSFSAYEEEVLEKYGLDYRRECLRDWHVTSILPSRLPMEWRQLSWHIPEPPVQLAVPAPRAAS